MIFPSLPGQPGAASTRLVVGLGNPGPRYAGTRHNVGFEVLDLLASRLGAIPEPLPVARAGEASLPRADWWRAPAASGGASPFALLWPLTYMNLSGRAVAAALRLLDADPSSIFVVTDDFHLPLGALRARADGSSGGHKGLLSIEESLGTQAYPRLRVGVGDPAGGAVDFVLSRFRASEHELVEETVETASWAAEDWAKGASISEIQARYNRRSP